jgi:GNAT superfamily N-acetyltransferase
VPIRETCAACAGAAGTGEPGRSICGRKITLATPDQAETLTQIAFAAKRHWGYPERWMQLWAPLLTITPEYIEQNETWVAWLVEQPVGFCAISQSGERASVDHLWVLPDSMGKGIGAALFEHILKRSKELGVHTLEIESDPNAQGFYERIGAKKVGEVVGEVDGQPRVLPLLELNI